MIKTLNVLASQAHTTVNLSSDELVTQPLVISPEPVTMGFYRAAVVIHPAASQATFLIRPSIEEREANTRRINRAIELGYLPPIQTTAS
jgi:hypothetical protein